VGDAYVDALTETINGQFKAECIRTPVFRAGPGRTLADVECMTAGWVDWYNTVTRAGSRATGTAATPVRTKKTRLLGPRTVSTVAGLSKQVLVREAGLEPARPKTPGPKPGAAANYATRARRTVYG
jgi:hypothetical protein